ncbi:MAG: hypothetical protein K0Q92_1238 [Steroidobacteraceae bacterium]|nr:hypothetical protein [Steroidobacteraceae bacterium]
MISVNGCRGWLGAALLAAMAAAGPAAAGEFQLALRAGQNWIDVDADRLSSGNGVNEHQVNLGLTAAYRWQQGAYVEAGLGGSGSLNFLSIQDVSHHWIGAGWQYELYGKALLTPKVGLTYSELTSSEEDLFDSEPVDKFSDVVPFLEVTLEKRLMRHFGLGVYFRHTFEDWGSTRDFGLALSYTFGGQ